MYASILSFNSYPTLGVHITHALIKKNDTSKDVSFQLFLPHVVMHITCMLG